MTKDEISFLVDDKIKYWHEDIKYRNIKLTPDAINLIKLLIQYIKEDPSKVWLVEDLKMTQSQAISILPLLLSEIVRDVSKDSQLQKNMTISTWEILHSITTIVTTNCFIKKKK